MKIKKVIFNSIGVLVISCFFFSHAASKSFSMFLNDIGTSQDAITGSKEEYVVQKDFDYLPTSTTHQLIKHRYYTLSYDERAEQAEWVAYKLKKEYIQHKGFKRPRFVVDPMVKTGSADWRNYKKSGYDKGHLCPAGDMEFDIDAYNDTFFTSNIAPQTHKFNAGIWKRLEEKTRYWALKYDSVYVVTGGIFKNSRKTIGKEKVFVPECFYKIIINNSNKAYKMIAFLMPDKKSDKSLFQYVVSVDSIEKMTGIDFFPKLDDRIENNLEKNTDYSSWFIKKN